MMAMAMMFDGCQGRKAARKGEVALAHGSSHSNQKHDHHHHHAFDADDHYHVNSGGSCGGSDDDNTDKGLLDSKQMRNMASSDFPESGNLLRTMAGCQQAPPTVKIVEQQFYGDQPFSLRSKHLPAQNYPTWSECWCFF